MINATSNLNYNQGCQEDFWSPGQGFEMRPLHECHGNFCEFILHGFQCRTFLRLKFISNACVKPGKLFTMIGIGT